MQSRQTGKAFDMKPAPRGTDRKRIGDEILPENEADAIERKIGKARSSRR